MGDLIQVSKTTEIEDGAMKEVVAQGKEILLARVGDSYYAVANRCPHMGGKLSQGRLEGTVVTCPRHGSRFDLKDGRVVRWLKGAGLFSKVGKILKSPRQLVTYKVSVDGENILLEI
ncbi:Rieske (2Fe-2S) protein [Chloroflexota bacterium]